MLCTAEAILHGRRLIWVQLTAAVHLAMRVRHRAAQLLQADSEHFRGLILSSVAGPHFKLQSKLLCCSGLRRRCALDDRSVIAMPLSTPRLDRAVDKGRS